MAKVATPGPGPLPSNSLHFGSGGGGVASKATTAVKRKTPSELRVSFPKCVFIMFHGNL